MLGSDYRYHGVLGRQWWSSERLKTCQVHSARTQALGSRSRTVLFLCLPIIQNGEYEVFLKNVKMVQVRV